MEEHERPHYEELVRQLRRIDPWLARVNSEAPRWKVDPKSPLSGDDRCTHPYETSYSAWHSLSHAVDHLHMLRSVLVDARVIHMYAPYSLIRAALENAAATVWMLSPASRAERVLRRLRFAAVDINKGEAVRKLVDKPGRRTVEERLDDLRKIARQAGIDEKQALRRVGYEEIVSMAAHETYDGEVIAGIVWRGCSGIAHGDLWTTIAFADRIELPGAPEGVAHLRVTANVETLQGMTRVAVDMADFGWRLLDKRGRSPYS